MPDQKQRKTTRRQEIKRSMKSVESKAKAKRSWLERVEDKIVSTFGTAEFLLFNLLFFAGWIAVWQPTADSKKNITHSVKFPVFIAYLP